jgi:hypothetical protein
MRTLAFSLFALITGNKMLMGQLRRIFFGM